MSEILSKLVACEQVTEWIDPWDERLVIATGETAPNRGALVREDWKLCKGAGLVTALIVHRLIVPSITVLSGEVKPSFDTQGAYIPDDRGTVSLHFTESSDWLQCFPANKNTEIFRTLEDEQAWAAIALCGKVLGLAVFGLEGWEGGVEARIQPVPADIFLKIIEATPGSGGS